MAWPMIFERNLYPNLALFKAGAHIEVNDPHDVIVGTPWQDDLYKGFVITCAHCGNTFTKRPENGCPGCAGREFK